MCIIHLFIYHVHGRLSVCLRVNSVASCCVVYCKSGSRGLLFMALVVKLLVCEAALLSCIDDDDDNDDDG